MVPTNFITVFTMVIILIILMITPKIVYRKILVNLELSNLGTWET